MKIWEKIKAWFCVLSTFVVGVLFLIFRGEKEKRVKAENRVEALEKQTGAIASTAGKISNIKEEKSQLISKVAEVAVSVTPAAQPEEGKEGPSTEPQKVVTGADFNKMMEDLW